MNTYKDKFERTSCPVCHGTGFKFVADISGFDTVKPCDCKEGKERRYALTKPKEETTENG